MQKNMIFYLFDFAFYSSGVISELRRANQENVAFSVQS